MSGVYALILFIGVFGMFPLAIILYKRQRTIKMIKTGIMAKARFYRITATRKSGESVQYCFYDEQGQLAYGSLLSNYGKFKENDVIDVFYFSGNPKRSTVKGAWKSPVLLIFGIVIAAFMWFAVYKLFEMVNNGAL